jgi:hypothetical protein
MHTLDGGHVDAAIEALADRAFELAGDEYTRGAWQVLAEPRPEASPFEGDENGWVGDGLRWLGTAAVCYRVADREARATRRGVEGVAVARDLAACLDHPVQRACCSEFVADIRVAAAMDDVEAAYQTAITEYEEAAAGVDDPQRWATTPLFQAAAGTIKHVARGPADGEIAVAWEELHGPDPAAPGPFLAHRATYKRQRFPGLVERVVDDGSLAAPRGTTEYDNDTYRCPACESTDVNWIADLVLCLRCSTPMVDQ